VDTGGFRYYYNPCKVFSLPNGCDSVYVSKLFHKDHILHIIAYLILQACQESSDGSNRYPLADENTEVMYYDVDNDETSVVLYYSSPTDSENTRYYP